MPDADIVRREAERCATLPDAARVQRMELEGRTFWLKIEQERGIVLRLRKGSARDLLAREADAIAAMSARDLPVPRLVVRAPGYFVLADAGTPLDHALRTGPDRAELLVRAATALADLHAAGAAHGSPHLRNMCLGRGGAIRFIDLEGATAENAALAARAYDLRLLVFSVLATFPGERALAAQTLAAYGAASDASVSRAAAQWAASHGWLAWLAAPLRWHEDRFRPDRTYRQYGAVRDTLAVLKRGGAGPEAT